MMAEYFGYCSNFLNNYGRIETIKEDWEYVTDFYKNHYIFKNDVIDLFTNFLKRYGCIESIKEDWEYHKQNI
jgi:hypothetical protein